MLTLSDKIMPTNEIVDQIRAAVAAVTRQHEFLKWLKEEKVGDGLVLLNNSFIFRQKLQTIKNDLYLGIPVRNSFHLGVSNVVVARGIAFNSDFKFVELKGMKKLEVQEINPAIDQQLKQLGSIVMVLIGEVLDTVVTRAPIGHSLFSELEKAHGAQLPTDLVQPLASALDYIRKNHYAVLRLPGESALSRPLLDSFVDGLRQNLARYKHAWNKCKGQADIDAGECNDLLRIVYNCATDTVLVIRLLVDTFYVLASFSRIAIDKVFHQQSLGFHLALCRRTSRLAPDFALRAPLPVRSIMSCAFSAL